jgi:DNA-binding CsgD family transcriptional regulator
MFGITHRLTLNKSAPQNSKPHKPLCMLPLNITDNEREVITALGRAESSEDIGKKLCVTEQVVNRIIRELAKKLKVNSRLDLAKLGLHVKNPLAIKVVEPLNKRELEICKLLNQNFSTKDIGDQLKISPTATRYYIQKIYKKMPYVSNRLGLGLSYESGISNFNSINQKNGQPLKPLCMLPLNITDVERQIITGLGESKSSKQIGDNLSIGEHAVNHHVRKLLKKLHIPTCVDLAKLGLHIKKPLSFKVYEPLTQREFEICKLLNQSFSSKAIAKKLKISESTVNVHVYQIYGKIPSISRRIDLALCYEQSPETLMPKSKPIKTTRPYRPSMAKLIQPDNQPTTLKAISPLNTKQLEVCKLISQNLDSKQIAKKMGISVSTVCVHVSDIYQKIPHAFSRSDLSRWYHQTHQ